MGYILMHKHVQVANIELDDVGSIKKIIEVYSPQHFPVGVLFKKGVPDRTALNEWWADRVIPDYRIGFKEVLKKLKIDNPKMLLPRCLGLSLSDQYWIKPENSSLNWNEVNYFQHPFSEDFGDVLFGISKNENEINFSSPDITTDGFLKKRWKIIDGKRCLIKGGSNPFCQQPFCEVVATEIMSRLGIPHVPYTLMWENDIPFSACDDFINEYTELIPAWRVMMIQKKRNNVSVYGHFVNCCNALGIKGVVPFLDRMITLDYIIANEDRHFNNFGVIRNAETLEWLGIAPVYDSGTSLGYDKLSEQMRNEKDVVCKPFKKYHFEQLSLVSSFDWFDLSRLSDVDDVIRDVFSQNVVENFVDEKRIEAIVNSVKRRIRNLEQIIIERSSKSFLVDSSSTKNDVVENVAEDYSDK